MEEKITTVSAKTLDEAITKALIDLQTTSEHLHYEVIQKESSGLLGIFGAKPCIIRARVMSEEEEAAVKKAAAEKAAAEKAAAEKAAAEKAEAEKAAAKKAAAEKVAAEKAAAEKAAAEKAAAGKAAVEKTVTAATAGVKAADAVGTEKPAVEKPAPKVDEAVVKKAAKEFLVQVFGAMGMTVEIETSYNASDRELQVMMSGEDMGILIGKRGQTLDSLQYLVSLVVNRETEGYLRVKLDTENYRERRKETLETLAKNISYKVKRTKHPVSLEPMNPYERRIIHSALQNDRYVVTRSEGEDPYRHVVISLKREGYSGEGAERGEREGRRDNHYSSRRGGRDNRNGGRGGRGRSEGGRNEGARAEGTRTANTRAEAAKPETVKPENTNTANE